MSRLSRVKRAEVQSATQMHAEDQIASENFSFFFGATRLSHRGQTGENVRRISERDDTRESARAFYIILYIFVEKRETEDKER